MCAVMVVSLMAGGAPPVNLLAESPGELAEVIRIYSKGRVQPKQAKDMADAVSSAGTTFNIDPIFLLAVGYTESRWTLTTRGDGGRSVGMYQMVLSAARAVEFGGIFEDDVARDTAYRSKRRQIALLGDVWVASLTAAAYLSRLRRKYGKSADVVYNCGPVRCRSSDGKGRIKETRATRGYWRNYRKLLKLTKR